MEHFGLFAESVAFVANGFDFKALFAELLQFAVYCGARHAELLGEQATGDKSIRRLQ